MNKDFPSSSSNKFTCHLISYLTLTQTPSLQPSPQMKNLRKIRKFRKCRFQSEHKTLNDKESLERLIQLLLFCILSFHFGIYLCQVKAMRFRNFSIMSTDSRDFVNHHHVALNFTLERYFRLCRKKFNLFSPVFAPSSNQWR